MTSDAITEVFEYADLEDVPELSDRERDAIAHLATDGEITLPFGAAWLPEWLAEEKGLRPVEGTEQVFRGHFTEETDKAIRVYQDEAREWLPKSQGHYFAAEPHVEVDTPTRTLDEWGDA